VLMPGREIYADGYLTTWSVPSLVSRGARSPAAATGANRPTNRLVEGASWLPDSSA